MERYDAVTVGILVADVLVKPVEALPEQGKLCLVDSIELYSGGNAMTAAVNMAKLGLKTAVAGRVGQDLFGDFLIQCLEEYGVSHQGVSRDRKAQTSASVALLSKGAERSFLHCKGANACLRSDDIPMELIEKARLVFVTGGFVLDHFDGAPMAAFLKKCKAMGKLTAVDVCWNQEGSWELIHQAMPYIDWFMPSVDEAREISGEEEPEAMAVRFFELGVGHVVIKCGADGCYLKEHRARRGRRIPACKTPEVVDTTGAGDSFCSGFLAALLKGENPEVCAQFANAAGGCNVMARGAVTGIKSYEDTWKFMLKYQ